MSPEGGRGEQGARAHLAGMTAFAHKGLSTLSWGLSPAALPLVLGGSLFKKLHWTPRVKVQLFSTCPPELTPGTRHQRPVGPPLHGLRGSGAHSTPVALTTDTRPQPPLVPSPPPGRHGQCWPTGCTAFLSSPSGGWGGGERGSLGPVSFGAFRSCVGSESSVLLSCYTHSEESVARCPEVTSHYPSLQCVGEIFGSLT